MKYHTISFDEERIPADIETLTDRQLTGYEINLFGLGTKERPLRLSSMEFQYHPDGVYCEMAPLTAYRGAERLLMYRDSAVQNMDAMLGMRTEGRDYLDLRKIRGFSEVKTPRLYEASMTFGCSPDYYRGKRRIVPPAVRKSPYREGSFHLHMDLAEQFCDTTTAAQRRRGVDPSNAAACAQIAAEFYEATAFLHPVIPQDVRLWYRIPRVYRPKPYGIEYRSIGSSITNDADRLAMLIDIAFQFMADHFNTHSVRRYVA